MSSSTRRGMTTVAVVAAVVIGAVASVGLGPRQEQWSHASDRIFDGAPSRSRLGGT